MNAPRTNTESPAPPSASPAADGFAALDSGHRRIFAVIGELERLAEAVERDAVVAETRAAAAAIADFFCTVARSHHEDEERHVFPALLASGDARLVQAALQLQNDHRWLEEDWLEVEPLVQAIAMNVGSCDADALRHGVEVIAALYRDHVALEESLAYPEARARLGAARRYEMGREMARRRRAARVA